MIQLKDKSLIIELDCTHQEPLALLCDLQKGLIDMFSLITYAYDEVPPVHLTSAVYNMHILFKAMLVGRDQGEILNESLTKDKIIQFNKMGEKIS